MKKYLFVCLFVWLNSANATLITESGDAGSLTNSAQSLGGGITQISGVTSSSDREDLYSFSWGGGLFQASTNGSFSSSFGFDTMLFLFDGLGTFITANDDSAGGFGSLISATLSSGDYFLGISGFSNDARNAANGVFRSGATGILNNWEGGGNTGLYTIGLNSATAARNNVPEPATMALLALGFAGIGFSRKRNLLK